MGKGRPYSRVGGLSLAKTLGSQEARLLSLRMLLPQVAKSLAC